MREWIACQSDHKECLLRSKVSAGVLCDRHAATRHTIGEALLKLVDQGADGCTEYVCAIQICW